MFSLPFKITNEMIYTEVMQKSDPPKKYQYMFNGSHFFVANTQLLKWIYAE